MGTIINLSFLLQYFEIKFPFLIQKFQLFLQIRQNFSPESSTPLFLEFMNLCIVISRDFCEHLT